MAAMRIRYGTQRSASDAGILIALERGYFDHEDLQIELVDLRTHDEMIEALSVGTVEAAGVSPVAAFFNAAARGVGVKSVAERGSNTIGHGYCAFLGRRELVKSRALRDTADLRGLKVGVLAPVGGVSVSVDLLVALEGVRLTWSDVEVVGLPRPELDEALKSGDLDVAVTSEPFVSLAVRAGYATRWKGVDEVYPGHMVGGLAYGPRFMADEPEGANAFMRAYVRGVHDYNRVLEDSGQRAWLLGLLAEQIGVADPSTLEEMVLPSIGPEPFVNRISVARDQEAYIRLGTVSKRVALDDFIDDTYVRAALKALPHED
jgi:NitT/TauT family transport system substrate-binding protein